MSLFSHLKKQSGEKMKADYKFLQDRINKINQIIDDIINHSQSVYEDEKQPFIDRSYFSHIFSLFHFYWTGLFDTNETIDELIKRDEKERIKFLLTNLPEATDDNT